MRWFETFKWFGPDISRKETAGKESEPEPASGVGCDVSDAMCTLYVLHNVDILINKHT